MILSSTLNSQDFYDGLITGAFSSFIVDLNFQRRINVVLNSITTTEQSNKNASYMRTQGYNLVMKLIECGENDLAEVLALELDLI